MITTAMLAMALAQAGRNTPLALGEGLRKLDFSLGREGFGNLSRTQVGRLQVAQWSATTDDSPASVAAGLTGWIRTSDYNYTYERVVDSVRQTLDILQAQDGSRLFSTVALSEWPPSDGSVPRDWPTSCRGGIFRILPGQLKFLREHRPERISTTLNPAGMGAEALYVLQASLAEVDKEIRSQAKGWTRVDARSEVAYKAPPGGEKGRDKRRLYSLTISQRDGAVRVVARWAPSPGDFAGSQPPASLSALDARPRSTLPKLIASALDGARLMDSGVYGGRAIIWKAEMPLPYGKAFWSAGCFSEQKLQDQRASVELFGKNCHGLLSISAGRSRIVKTLPGGWLATLDVAGFWDSVVVETDRATTVTLVETLTAPDPTWPKAACYTWPPTGWPAPPFPEMNRQPLRVTFDGAFPSSAQWEFETSATRRKQIQGARFKPSSGSPLQSLSIWARDDRHVAILARYRRAR